MADDDKRDLPAKVDHSGAPDAVVGEVVEALKQERIGQININILLQRVTEKHEDPDVMLERTEKMLALADRYERDRLKAFQERANAIIDVKLRDPDEVEKRHNNRARRCLKYAVGVMSISSLAGTIYCVAVGASVVLAGLLGCAGALGLAMLGPMASGESVSSTDIVRIVNAIRGAAHDAEDQDRLAKQKKKK